MDWMQDELQVRHLRYWGSCHNVWSMQISNLPVNRHVSRGTFPTWHCYRVFPRLIYYRWKSRRPLEGNRWEIHEESWSPPVIFYILYASLAFWGIVLLFLGFGGKRKYSRKLGWIYNWHNINCIHTKSITTWSWTPPPSVYCISHLL